MNPFLRELSPGLKLMYFGIFFFLGAGLGGVLAIAVGTLFFGISPGQLSEIMTAPGSANAEAVKWISNATQIGTFIVPVILFISFFGSADIGGYRLKKISWMALVVPVWIAFSSGVIDLTSEFNHWLIPQGSHLEQLFKPLEEQASELTKLILSDTTAWGLFTTLLTIALIPAISEELMFRGVLQPLLAKATGRPHLAIWTTAVLFSFIHFQFYGFIPRVLLGAMLGYAVYWSGSLWTSVIAHFANNALALVFFHINGQSLSTPEGGFQASSAAYVSSAVVCAGLGYFLWRNREKPADITIFAPPEKGVS